MDNVIKILESDQEYRINFKIGFICLRAIANVKFVYRIDGRNFQTLLPYLNLELSSFVRNPDFSKI